MIFNELSVWAELANIRAAVSMALDEVIQMAISSEEKTTMRRGVMYIYLAVLCLTAVSAYSQSLTTYDAFNGNYINPDKWLNGWGMCGGNGYDCTRDVQDGRLRLKTRAYGGRDTDTGVDFSGSGLGFPFPNQINAIEIRFKVKSFSGAACPSSTDEHHSQQLLFGSFFNSGSG